MRSIPQIPQSNWSVEKSGYSFMASSLKMLFNWNSNKVSFPTSCSWYSYGETTVDEKFKVPTLYWLVVSLFYFMSSQLLINTFQWNLFFKKPSDNVRGTSMLLSFNFKPSLKIFSRWLHLILFCCKLKVGFCCLVKNMILKEDLTKLEEF